MKSTTDLVKISGRVVVGPGVQDEVDIVERVVERVEHFPADARVARRRHARVGGEMSKDWLESVVLFRFARAAELPAAAYRVRCLEDQVEEIVDAMFPPRAARFR